MQIVRCAGGIKCAELRFAATFTCRISDKITSESPKQEREHWIYTSAKMPLGEILQHMMDSPSAVGCSKKRPSLKKDGQNPSEALDQGREIMLTFFFLFNFIKPAMFNIAVCTVEAIYCTQQQPLNAHGMRNLSQLNIMTHESNGLSQSSLV